MTARLLCQPSARPIGAAAWGRPAEHGHVGGVEGVHPLLAAKPGSPRKFFGRYTLARVFLLEAQLAQVFRLTRGFFGGDR